MVNCPDCDSPIDVDEEELDEGDSLICEECGAELKVLGLDPLELESVEEDEDEEEERPESAEGDDDEHWH
jgi:alpha-aminoadipate carrier protein LysW